MAHAKFSTASTSKFRAGETLVILGGSGSGKSTLLRTLVGLERPSERRNLDSRQEFRDHDGDERDDLRKKMGMSFQSGALFGSMTVGENVALPLREHTHLDDSTIEIMVRLKLDQVGLSGFENYMPAQLSGGMKKRAAIARALAMDPGNSVFRRAFGRPRSHHRRGNRRADPEIEESVPHHDSGGHARTRRAHS